MLPTFRSRKNKFFKVGSLTSGSFTLVDTDGVTLGHVTVNEKDGMEKFIVTGKDGHFGLGHNRKGG